MGRNWRRKIVEKDVLEQTTATETKTAHKPFVIKQKWLHPLCFIALHDKCLAHCASEFSSLHINSLISECGILIPCGVEAQTHNTVSKDTKPDIFGCLFSDGERSFAEEIYFLGLWFSIKNIWREKATNIWNRIEAYRFGWNRPLLSICLQPSAEPKSLRSRAEQFALHAGKWTVIAWGAENQTWGYRQEGKAHSALWSAAMTGRSLLTFRKQTTPA